eukprot:7670379-Ditylum_brightwellii.AAC.1
MIVTYKTKTIENKDVCGLEYKFIDSVFKGYTGQDNIQVDAALEVLIAMELIPFIYHLNWESRKNGNPTISKWIYPEAQTGRGRLDTHFSYLTLVLKSYVEDGNDAVLEDHILNAIAFCGGVA